MNGACHYRPRVRGGTGTPRIGSGSWPLPTFPRLYSIAHRLVDEEAEDVAQDCLLRAWRAFGLLEDESAARAWLTSILANCCRDRRRIHARRVEEVSLDEVDEFSLYRMIANEDPCPYSDSLYLDFLKLFPCGCRKSTGFRWFSCTCRASLPKRWPALWVRRSGQCSPAST